jgi:GNAT superfamily N-acetyltransferase
MASNGKWSIELLKADGTVALQELSVACFGEGAQSAEFFQQRFFGAPGPDADVVVARSGGRLVGAQAVTYLEFLIGGRPETAGMFTDGMTHPEHRRKGIFRALRLEAERRAFDKGASLLFTMPNDLSLPSFQHSPGWHVLPDRVLLARVLDVGGLLQDWGLPRPLARGTDALTHWAVRNGSHLDTRGLDWRFFKNPSWRYRYFVARDASGSPCAYLVTAGERRMGTLLCYAVDMLWTDKQSMVRLLDFAALALKNHGARVFGSIVSSPSLTRVLRGAGFSRVPPAVSKRSFHTAYAVHPSRQDVAAVARQGDAWFLSLADFDTI